MPTATVDLITPDRSRQGSVSECGFHTSLCRSCMTLAACERCRRAGLRVAVDNPRPETLRGSNHHDHQKSRALTSSPSSVGCFSPVLSSSLPYRTFGADDDDDDDERMNFNVA